MVDKNLSEFVKMAPLLDEDDMASDSAAHGTTQQAAKAYVDGRTPATRAQIKTGTYTGDGTEGQGITGVGFLPKFVLINLRPTSEASIPGVFKLDQTWGDYARFLVSNTALDNRINSLDADGFTVDDDGTDKNPNANGVTYDYLALG